MEFLFLSSPSSGSLILEVIGLLRTCRNGSGEFRQVLSILEILTTTSFYLSIQIIPDPAVTSFIGTLFSVILTGMGIVFLHERFTWLESFGARHGRPFWSERIGYVLITWKI